VLKRIDRKSARLKRHRRIRNTLQGTPQRPRLCVFRSLSHIYAQVIDDIAGTTLVAASTVEAAVRDGIKNTSNIEAAEKVGKVIAERSLEKGIKAVVFDRGGNIYHGRIAALAKAARDAGLEF